MSRGLCTTSMALVVALSAVGASGQSRFGVDQSASPPQEPGRRDPRILIRVAPDVTAALRLKREIAVMESILRRKVEGAASELTRRIEVPTATGAFMLSGPARAQGYRLDGYGYVFHVDVPSFSQTFLWSVSVIGPPDPAVKSIRDYIDSIPDARQKDRLDLALRQIELQLPRLDVRSDRGETKEGRWVNPDEAYRSQVTDALKDAMLDHSGPLQIAGEEWLTVTARGADADLDLSDFRDESTSVIIRVRGSDLTAFREGRIGRDEARKRFEVREF